MKGTNDYFGGYSWDLYSRTYKEDLQKTLVRKMKGRKNVKYCKCLWFLMKSLCIIYDDVSLACLYVYYFIL
jgi:hypothetical protein